MSIYKTCIYIYTIDLRIIIPLKRIRVSYSSLQTWSGNWRPSKEVEWDDSWCPNFQETHQCVSSEQKQVLNLKWGYLLRGNWIPDSQIPMPIHMPYPRYLLVKQNKIGQVVSGGRSNDPNAVVADSVISQKYLQHFQGFIVEWVTIWNEKTYSKWP